MLHSIYGEGRVPIGEDVDQGLGIDEQASNNVLNPNTVGPKLPLRTVEGPRWSL